LLAQNLDSLVLYIHLKKVKRPQMIAQLLPCSNYELGPGDNLRKSAHILGPIHEPLLPFRGTSGQAGCSRFRRPKTIASRIVKITSGQLWTDSSLPARDTGLQLKGDQNMSAENASNRVAPEKIKHLESRYETICKDLPFVDHKQLSDSEFFKIIHNPPYTTLQDVAIANTFLDAMREQVNAIAKLHNGLISNAGNSVTAKAA
jgi:hypothetical protein